MGGMTPADILTRLAIAAVGTAVLVVLPAGPAAVVAGTALAAFAGGWAVSRAVEASASPVTVATRCAAGALVVLGGPLLAVATLGPRAVPVLFVAGTLLALALWPLLAPPARPGQAPRNVDR